MKPKTETKVLAPQSPATENNRAPAGFTHEQLELIKRTVCKGASDDELQLFLAQCRRTGLDPFARQIYSIRRWDARERREVMTHQTSIDGFRLIADRTGKYEGQVGPFWCGPDGTWHDVWLEDGPPAAAKVGVLKAGCREPFWSIARFSEYVQTDRDGNPVSMWRKMPANQLAKCGEALSLRKAFPQEMSGLYSLDEMSQADTDSSPSAPPVAMPPEPPPARPARPWATFKGMIEAFSKLHGRLRPQDDHIYRETLAEFNVQHSNQFKDVQLATAAYHLLLERVIECEAQAADESGREMLAKMREEIKPPEEEANP